LRPPDPGILNLGSTFAPPEFSRIPLRLEAPDEALELAGEALVVDAELVEHGGVEVVDGDGVPGDAVAEFWKGEVGSQMLLTVPYSFRCLLGE